MNTYVQSLKTKNIVYVFNVGDGGIGDAVKFFMYALMLCMKHNIQLYYLKQDIPLESYLLLKYPSMYINREQLTNTRTITEGDIETLEDNVYNIVTPYTFYSTFSYDTITIPIQDVFYFSNEVIENNIIPKLESYTSIHLRLGDKYLETDTSFVVCKNDTRQYSEEVLFQYIENHKDDQLIFCCDNNEYKQFIKQKYPNVIISQSSIGHTGLHNTTKKQVLDAVTELYILTKSKKIISVSYSGFSKIASKFRNIPLINI